MRATWTEDGEKRSVTRKVAVSAGQVSHVDLRRPWLGLAPWGKGIRSGYPTLTVINGTGRDAAVKVIQLGVKKRLVRNFYLPRGKRFTAEQIPAGRYVLRVAFGSDWDMTERKFSSNRSFSESDAFVARQEETGEGVRYSRLTITLHKVINGNFDSEPISEERFDQE